MGKTRLEAVNFLNSQLLLFLDFGLEFKHVLLQFLVLTLLFLVLGLKSRIRCFGVLTLASEAVGGVRHLLVELFELTLEVLDLFVFFVILDLLHLEYLIVFV